MKSDMIMINAYRRVCKWYLGQRLCFRKNGKMYTEAENGVYLGSTTGNITISSLDRLFKAFRGKLSVVCKGTKKQVHFYALHYALL
jgi:hypothetical protein